MKIISREAVLKLYATDVCDVDEIVYHYFINEKSTTTSRGLAYHIDRLDI